MGLDQSAYALKKIEEFPDFSDDNTLFIPCEFDNWGKFWSLYEWMRNLYYEKGGTAEVFNCVYLRLTTQDLERLDRDSDSKDFYEHCSSYRTPEDEMYVEFKHLKQFIECAKENIEKGYAVYYWCWF